MTQEVNGFAPARLTSKCFSAGSSKSRIFFLLRLRTRSMQILQVGVVSDHCISVVLVDLWMRKSLGRCWPAEINLRSGDILAACVIISWPSACRGFHNNMQVIPYLKGVGIFGDNSGFHPASLISRVKSGMIVCFSSKIVRYPLTGICHLNPNSR